MSKSNQNLLAAAYGLTLDEIKSLAESGMETYRTARRTAAWLRAKLERETVSPELREVLG